MGPGATIKLLLGGDPFEAGLNEAASGLAAMGVRCNREELEGG